MGLKGTDPGGRLGPSHSELRKRREKQGPQLDPFPHLYNWLEPRPHLGQAGSRAEAGQHKATT